MQKQDEKNEEVLEEIKNKMDEETKVEEVIEEPKNGEKEKSKKEKRKKETVEKQKEEYEKKEKKKKKKLKIAIIIGTILFVILMFSIIFAVINLNNHNMINGISINGIEVSGMSKEEVKEKLSKIIEEKEKKQILIKHGDFETEISPELLEVKYDLDGAIDKAYNTGRDGNIFANNYSILFTMVGKKNIEVEYSLNEEVLNKTLQDASAKLPGAIKESSYYIEDDKLIITRGTKGVAINVEDAANKIKENLKDINKKNSEYIELFVEEREPKDIDLDKIYQEVHKDAKDAYYTKEPFEIFPEVNGVDFNLEEAKKLLAESKEEYTITLTITKPKVTIEDIGTEAFPDRLSVFTTRYDASNYNRTTNLRLACQKINGTILMPGDTFSYNKTLGERTIAAGYKEAKIYAAGEVVDGLGGGICQISSTLYNAVVMANLQIVERSNHQFVTSYLPAGRDATVVYGAIDFKFKNTRKYPVRLTANVQNGIATVEVFGIKEDQEYTITFDTRTVGTIAPSTKYEDDPSLAEGEEVVKQKGTNGIQTETYITKNLDGKVVSRDLLSKDTYTPMQRIVKRGTKAVAPVAPVEPTPQPEPQPQPQPEPVTTEPIQPTQPEQPAEQMLNPEGV